jgi:hypothetical protein
LNVNRPEARSPQGWIASAQTYRLIFNEDGLHLIHFGRTMGSKVKSGDMIADALANKIVNRMEAKMEANLFATEKEIEGIPLTALFRRKKCYQIPTGETGAVTCKIHPKLPPRLMIRATGLKLKLIAPHDDGPAGQKLRTLSTNPHPDFIARISRKSPDFFLSLSQFKKGRK